MDNCGGGYSEVICNSKFVGNYHLCTRKHSYYNSTKQTTATIISHCGYCAIACPYITMYTTSRCTYVCMHIMYIHMYTTSRCTYVCMHIMYIHICIHTCIRQDSGDVEPKQQKVVRAGQNKTI